MSVLGEFPRAHTFIETGYGKGETFKAALKYDYERLVTIEVDFDTCVKAAGDIGAGFNYRVQLVHGDSGKILGDYIDPATSTVFWLDAHYSGGGYDSDGRIKDLPQCPLLDELRQIREKDWLIPPTIYIDDLSMFLPYKWQLHNFQARGFKAAEWPTLKDIEREGYVVLDAKEEVLKVGLI